MDCGRQLVAAAAEGNRDILLQLLDQSADINGEANDCTALIAAAGGGHKDVSSLLLDRGDRKSVV